MVSTSSPSTPPTLDLSNFNPFEGNVIEMEYVGSRVTCNPAPTDTDEDILILTDNLVTLQKACWKDGFDGSELYVTEGLEGTYKGDFYSMRKGDINLIITEDKDFYERFTLASYVCKQLNVLEKKDRITVFQALLYNNRK
jgi:hypothetical protein